MPSTHSLPSPQPVHQHGRIFNPTAWNMLRVCAADMGSLDSFPQRRLRGGRTVSPRIIKLSNVSARKLFPGHCHRRVDGVVSRPAVEDGDKLGKVSMAATPMIPISAYCTIKIRHTTRKNWI